MGAHLVVFDADQLLVVARGERGSGLAEGVLLVEDHGATVLLMCQHADDLKHRVEYRRARPEVGLDADDPGGGRVGGLLDHWAFWLRHARGLCETAYPNPITRGAVCERTTAAHPVRHHDELLDRLRQLGGGVLAKHQAHRVHVVARQRRAGLFLPRYAT